LWFLEVNQYAKGNPSEAINKFRFGDNFIRILYHWVSVPCELTDQNFVILEKIRNMKTYVKRSLQAVGVALACMVVLLSEASAQTSTNAAASVDTAAIENIVGIKGKVITENIR
jgi:hypothetical protein